MPIIPGDFSNWGPFDSFDWTLLKSLKMYLQQYRNEGIFYENVTNVIFDDFIEMVSPKKAKLTARWTPRGGIRSIITAEYTKES